MKFKKKISKIEIQNPTTNHNISSANSKAGCVDDFGLPGTSLLDCVDHRRLFDFGVLELGSSI